MEHNNFNPKMLRGIGTYLQKSFKFYDLKGDYIAPLVFVLILAVNFFSSYFFEPEVPSVDFMKPENFNALRDALFRMMMVSFAANIIIELFSAAYLQAYIKEARGLASSLKESFASTAYNSIKIIIAYSIVSAAIPIGAALLKLPGAIVYLAAAAFVLTVPLIILYIMLIFSYCYIMDKGCGLFTAFKSSIRLARGHKIEIFSVLLIFKFVTTMLMLFALSFVISPNSLIQLFVAAFVGSIFKLMETRIVALMYIDLEY